MVSSQRLRVRLLRGPGDSSLLYLGSYWACLLTMARNRTFKFLSWNVRGLNSRDKCVAVKAVIRFCRCGIVCLQETKLSSVSASKFFTFCGYHLREYCTLDASGTRGGCLRRGTRLCSFANPIGQALSPSTRFSEGGWTG